MIPALVIIDMQRIYVESLPKSEKKRIIPSQIALAEYFMANNFPIANVEMDLSTYGETIPELKKILDKYSKLIYHKKISSNAFTKPENKEHLDHKLRNFEVTHPIFAGVNASDCIINTIKGAYVLPNKFPTITSKDLIGDSPFVNDELFLAMKKAYATEVFSTYQDIIKSLEEFRTFQ